MNRRGGAPGNHFDNPGTTTLAYLHDMLGIDEDWTQWHSDGFTWWASATAQRFRVTQRSDSNGDRRFAVTLETDLFCEVDVDSRAGHIAIVYHQIAVHGGIMLHNEGRLRPRVRVDVVPGQEQAAANLLAQRSIMHLAVVEQQLAAAPQGARTPPRAGAIDVSGPPGRSQRPKVHPCLRDALTRMAASSPHRPTTFAGLDEAASVVSRYGPAVGGNREGWLVATQHYLTPAPTGTPGSLLKGMDLFAELGSTEVRIDAGVPHPLFGVGVAVRVRITVPDRIDDKTAHAWARTFNGMELSDAGPPSALGAWSLSEPQPPSSCRQWVHGTFHPDAMPFQITGDVIATIAVQRSQWWMHILRRHVAAGICPP
jgi:hypothetical protein